MDRVIDGTVFQSSTANLRPVDIDIAGNGARYRPEISHFLCTDLFMSVFLQFWMTDCSTFTQKQR